LPRKESKEKKDKILTVLDTVIPLFEHNFVTNNEIQTAIGSDSKARAHYWLKKLENDGYLKCTKRGIYDVTESGKNILREYEYYLDKQLIRLENCRIKYRVMTNHQRLIDKIDWNKITPMKSDVTHYHGKIDGHTVKLMVGSKNTFLEIATNHTTAELPEEAYYYARLDVERVLWDLESRHDVHFEGGITTHKPEFAIPSTIADMVLKMHGASQIRSSRGIFNKSKGRDADWEVKRLQTAQKIMRMPETLDEISETTITLEQMLVKMQRRKRNNNILNFASVSSEMF